MKHLLILLLIARTMTAAAAQSNTVTGNLIFPAGTISGVCTDTTGIIGLSITTPWASECAKKYIDYKMKDTAAAIRSAMASMAPVQADYTQASTGALDYIKNKPYGVRFFDKSGTQRPYNVKILTDTFSVNAGNDFTVDISPLSFVNIWSVKATAIKTSSTGYQCPSVNVDRFTNSTVYLDFTQGNNALPVLAVLFPGTVFVSSLTGVKVAVEVVGY